jgi:two-component system sensor histidine kinase HydH
MLGTEQDTSKMQNYAREIEKETRALSKTVTDFLHFARPVKISLRSTELEALVSGAVEDLKGARFGPYRVEVHASSAASDIVCDPSLIRQVLFNLLINAADAVGEDGLIRVSIDSDDVAGRVRLHVTDTGHGIPPDMMQKVFIPFFTTKPAGTGLGLPLVQKIVLAHDGEIVVDSTPNEGTRVSLSFPAEPSKG